MRLTRSLFLAGVFALLGGVTAAQAQQVSAQLDNLGNQSEPGSGTALVNLFGGTVDLDVSGLQAVPHDNPLGSGRILGYAAWLVNSENALAKINLGFLFPRAGGIATLSFEAPGGIFPGGSAALLFFGAGGALSSYGFNQVVITLETELDLNRSQPSGPPIAAGQIPGTPAAVTPPPAVEVLMGKLGEDVFSFSPGTVTIFSGQSVRWTNVSPAFVTPHTVTRADADGPFPGAGPAFDSGSVPFGGSFTRTFTLPPGFPATVFNYHCTPHTTPLDLGMRGRIVVVASPVTFHVTLTGSQEVPPVTTSATGTAKITFVPSTRTVIYDVTVTGLTGLAAHIHQAPAGVIGDVIVPFQGGPTLWSGQATLTPAQATALLSGGTYVNVHTQANPGGELRAQIK